MARLISHEQSGPYEVKPESTEASIWVCACGLSDKKPYCDGSHKRTLDEEPEALYVYGESDRTKL